jgi:hypothetical protein
MRCLSHRLTTQKNKAMSLHVEISQEAKEKLRKQQQVSTISSLIISVLALLLVGLVMAAFALNIIIPEKPTIEAYVPTNIKEDTAPNVRKVQTNTQQKPSSPSSSAQANVVVANTTSAVSVPVPDTIVSTPSMDFGNEQDIGTGGYGDGTDAPGGFGGIPSTMKKRCSKEDRLARLQESGGTPACEDAVVKSLDWFKKNQAANGSWGNSPGYTGLTLLAYLAHCETPVSEKYGEAVLKGLTYLINIGMQNDGKVSTHIDDAHKFPYEHAIATYALAEASTFCKQGDINVPNLFDVTQKAGQFIIDNQHKKSGSWAYSYVTDGEKVGDLSISAWQLQALKACMHTGLKFDKMTDTVRKGIDFVEFTQGKDGGFSYNAPNTASHAANGYHTLTGAGLLSLQMFDKGSSSNARAAAKYIEKNSKFDYNTMDSDLYAAYYEMQAMINRGDKGWDDLNVRVRDNILKNQNPDGGWKTPGLNNKTYGVGPFYITEPVYRNALNTLMLEVYYRFLPGSAH